MTNQLISVFKQFSHVIYFGFIELEIRKRLNQKGMLKYDWKGSPSGSAIKTKPSKKSFKKSGKG